MKREQSDRRKRISLSIIGKVTTKICASAGAVGIGLKFYTSFSSAFLTNSIVVLPIYPNIWDALFLVISGSILTMLQLKEVIQRA